MLTDMRQYRVNDPVEVVAIIQPLTEFNRGDWSRRTPAVGDQGSILQIIGPPENPRYYVISREIDPSLTWSANLYAAEIRLLQTPCGMVALAFAHALAAGLFDAAQLILTPALCLDFPASRLRSEYNNMFSYVGGSADDVHLLGLMNEWPGKLPTDVGSAYVGISGGDSNGDTWNEAVDVVVTRSDGRLLIRDIKWGRP
jgi:hypothetical protein